MSRIIEFPFEYTADGRQRRMMGLPVKSEGLVYRESDEERASRLRESGIVVLEVREDRTFRKKRILNRFKSAASSILGIDRRQSIPVNIHKYIARRRWD